MDLATPPVRYDEPLRLKRYQRRALFGLEDLQRDAACGSVDSTTGDVAAPDERTLGHVLQADKGLAFEEPFPDEGDVPLDGGLILRVEGTCRIGQEPTERRVLEEGAVEARLYGSAELEAGLQTVDETRFGHPPKKRKASSKQWITDWRS